MSKQVSKEQLELLEIKKADLISVISNIKAKFAEQEKSLMEEFGSNAVINLQTGEVKDQEPAVEAEVIK